MKRVIVSGAFDDLRFRDYRFIEEASKLGTLHVLLWSDDAVRAATGQAPKFPQVEREYSMQSIRYVSSITLLHGANNPDALPRIDGAAAPDIWAVTQAADTPAKRDWASRAGIECRVISDATLNIVPPAPPVPDNPQSSREKVVVTGSFDWFHSGHVRFFEECSELGDLYVFVGHDDNIKLLKGPGHPLFPAAQRRYIPACIRYAQGAYITTGHGWMDAEPDFQKFHPDIYAVNEDGDKPDKREFCQQHGIEYRVLKRLPKPGLPRRQSTTLRGF
jgi:cytidyltransferase-like protein